MASPGNSDSGEPDPEREGYSIRVASRLTSISCDTLRMWERRYGFPKPRRNAASVRLYSEHDIERLLLVSRALKAGYRPGEAIRLPVPDLRKVLAVSAEARRQAPTEAPMAASILSALEREDPDAVRSHLQTGAALLGPERFVTDLAAPVLEGVGEAWASGGLEPRHEHLLAAALSGQLRLLLSACDHASSGPVVVLATLPLEHHGLGLEMAALYLALRGSRPRLLGTSLPAAQIVQAARALKADAVGISLSLSSDPVAVSRELDWMVHELGATELWIGGRGALSVDIRHQGLKVVAEWGQLDQAVRRWAEAC